MTTRPGIAMALLQAAAPDPPGPGTRGGGRLQELAAGADVTCLPFALEHLIGDDDQAS